MLFELIKKINIIFVFKENEVFVIAPVVYVIAGIGINFHSNKLTKFLKLRKFSYPPNTIVRSGYLIA